MPKVRDRERILKAAREKQLVTHIGVLIRLTVDFSKETLQERRDRQEVFKEMRCKGLQLRLFYPVKLLLRIEAQMKCFPDEIKLKEFIITKPLWSEMSKGLIQENEDQMKIKAMNINVATSLLLSTLNLTKNLKKPNSANNQNRNRIIGWRSFGGLSAWRGRGENEEKGARMKKHNW